MRIIDVIVFRFRNTNYLKQMRAKGAMPWIERRKRKAILEMELGLLISLVSLFTKRTLVYTDFIFHNIDGTKMFYVHYLREYHSMYNVETGEHLCVLSKKWINLISKIITGRKYMIRII